MKLSPSCIHLIASFALLHTTSAQTYSNCNPLTGGSCPADSALGRSVSIDFTSGQSDSFTPQGNPTYDSNGVSFTVAKSGDSPQLTSKWYIMFGKVDVVVKAAPGAGIVSSFVMQSDALDEIDWEWLGADDAEVQSNYFGKGLTTNYNRGAFHADPNNQGGFKTYSIEWTANQIVWQIDGQTVRVLTPATAEANQYPQTPMQIKLGAWSGGDSANAAGTIAWARGPTVYSNGPFTMQVKSVTVSDYSTGSAYSYGDASGTGSSIKSNGGTINSGGGSSNVAEAPPITYSTSGGPIPFQGTHREPSSKWVTPTVYPWVPYATPVSTPSSPNLGNYPGLPSGWTVTDTGKVVPPSAAPSTSRSGPSTSWPRASAQAAPSSSGRYEAITTYNQQGFKTVVTVPVGWETMSKSYDGQGFLVMPTPDARRTNRRLLEAQARITGTHTVETTRSRDQSRTMAPAAPSSLAAGSATRRTAGIGIVRLVSGLLSGLMAAVMGFGACAMLAW